MAKDNLTVFQRLNRMFGPDGVKVPQDHTNRYSIGNQELLKTQSKEEFETAKLQAQQNKYLSGLWSKVDNELYQQTIHYETTRVGSYSDFEAMEHYPEISAALDIMMEEATTPNDKGQIVNVYSGSKRVKSIIEDLLFKKMHVHTNLPMWTRNMCKYGDNFIMLKTDASRGIVGVRQLPNFEIERIDGDITSGTKMHRGVIDGNSKNNDRTTFFWKGQDLEFKSWQIGHFRLLGDDTRLPYGTSMLEKARRIWKQLVLSEDAMLVYRVTRAPERRVYKIFVGNIDDADVESYVQQIQNRFKRAPIYDSQTGQIDVRYNQMGYDQDIFIPVRDENAATPIDTLPGAQNLDQIADIEYLQRKLFTALRVPKTFLGFEEPTGEGKNLSLQDIRFARTINRIQQAMIQELNKIVIIHLHMLGFSEDLDNFTITLNNPSTQSEMLKVEHEQQKFTAYKDAVTDAGNGYGIMSMTRAKRQILGWSDDEIKQDLLEQRMEKAAAAELENTANVIKNTGFFDKVDKIYGDIEVAREGGAAGDQDGEGGGASGGGGGFGGGGAIGGDLDFGDEEGADLEGEAGADVGAEDFGGEDFGDAEDLEGLEAEEPAEATEESFYKTNKLLNEQKEKLLADHKRKVLKHTTSYLDRLQESIGSKSSDIVDKDIISDKTLRVNEEIEGMMKEIDDKLGE
jgi:hypothetical protein